MNANDRVGSISIVSEIDCRSLQIGLIDSQLRLTLKCATVKPDKTRSQSVQNLHAVDRGLTDASRPRPINTFWPDVRTFADATALATTLLPGIGRSALRELDRALGNVAHAADWLDEVLEISNEDVGGRLVFYNVQFTEVNGTDAAPAVEAVIESFAPDGSDGPGFTRGDLDLIAGQL